MILTNHQAQAVYSAMCALDDIPGEIQTTFNSHGERVRVVVMAHGKVRVDLIGITHEAYTDKSAFAAAYGLVDLSRAKAHYVAQAEQAKRLNLVGHPLVAEELPRTMAQHVADGEGRN